MQYVGVSNLIALQAPLDQDKVPCDTPTHSPN